jgi:ubiquitin carboxyl-terminal hydrolase 8
MSYEYDLHYHHELILDKSKYKSKGLTGLINLGNKCFMNSILQCLSNTLKLTDYFLSAKYKEDDPDNKNKRRREYYVVLSYLNLLINAWDTNQVLKPKSFVENISKFVPKYFNLDQQDSHECLMYILDYLHKALSYEIEVDIMGTVKNDTDLLMKQSLEQWGKFYGDGYSNIIETFNGLFYNKVTCQNCPLKENVFEPFNCISLNIPTNESSTLKNCLESYFNEDEKIDTWKCEKCNKSGCVKSIKSWSFPNYLIIHLKRFTNDGSKIDSHIDFPIEDLNLTDYVSRDKNDPNNYIYSLYSVNYHSGNSKGGHYWSSCKNLDKNWYLYNDSDVTKLQNTAVLSKDAYILFYYRKYIKK